jgi:hypothetical protein
MAYAGDLKSLALTGVRVQIPPRAPLNPSCRLEGLGSAGLMPRGHAFTDIDTGALSVANSGKALHSCNETAAARFASFELGA